MTSSPFDVAPSAVPGARSAYLSRVDPRYFRAFLSALFPGLGQLAGREYLRAALLGGPVVVGAIALLAILLLSDRLVLATRLLDANVVLALLGVQAALLVLRIVAVLLALDPGHLRRTRAVVATAVLVGFVAVPQFYLGYVTYVAHDQLAKIFAPASQPAIWVPVANVTPPPPDPSDNPFVGPDTPPGTVAPWASPAPDSRVTVLLIGVDNGGDRTTMNTDTMIIASLDPTAKTVSLMSIPRDMVDVPLPDGRTWSRKINSLMAYARWHPGQFPGAPTPQSVLAGALSTLTGVQIDYWAQVNLPGLVKVVNAVGGIDVNVARAFCDPYYHEYGELGFAVKPGRYHMNGNQALAYARIRHPAGESDFTRALRQQEVVVALRDRLVNGGFLNDPIGLLESLGDTISTNITPDVISQYAALGRDVTRSHIYNAVVDPPLVRGTMDSRGSVQIPDIKGIRALARQLYPPAGTLPAGISPMTDVPDTRASNLPKLNCYGDKPPATTPAPPSASATPVPSGSGTPPPSPEPSANPSTPPPATPSPTPGEAPTETPTPAASETSMPATTTPEATPPP